jgi:hypothetical protein
MLRGMCYFLRQNAVAALLTPGLRCCVALQEDPSQVRQPVLSSSAELPAPVLHQRLGCSSSQ